MWIAPSQLIGSRHVGTKKSLSQVCYLPTLKFRFILEFKDQFDKYSWKTLDNLGVAYDNHSIMHALSA